MLFRSKIRSLITIDTVERFQGSERDIIILSLAINSTYMLEQIQSRTELDGILIDRRLNVSITRARKHLVILGSEKILSNDKIYASLIEYIKQNGIFVKL